MVTKFHLGMERYGPQSMPGVITGISGCDKKMQSKISCWDLKDNTVDKTLPSMSQQGSNTSPIFAP